MAAALSTLIDAKYDLKLKSDFIFCNPDSKSELLKPLRAWDLITKYAGKAGLKNPEVMTSTNFRKYTATVAQIVNLDENELEWLCNHMGHDIRVHREFYRLPSACLLYTSPSPRDKRQSRMPSSA